LLPPYFENEKEIRRKIIWNYADYSDKIVASFMHKMGKYSKLLGIILDSA